MAITYAVGTGTATSFGTANTNYSVPVPAGVAPGDIVVIAWGITNNMSAASVTSSGFTVSPNQFRTNVGGFGGYGVGTLWKAATAADTGNYTVTVAGSGGGGAGEAVAIKFSGASATQWDTTATANNGAANGTCPPVSVTTTVANTMLVWVTNEDGGWAAGTPPTGFTEIYDASTQIQIAVANQASAGLVTASGGTHGTSTALAVWLGALAPGAAPAPQAPFFNFF